MSSQELTSVSSATLSPCPSSIFSCNADNEIAEKSSNDTATIPSCLKHIAIGASVLEHTQNIQHQGNLMSEVAPESHPILICLQLLGPAILDLHNLQVVLGLKPLEIPKNNTQTVRDCEESIPLGEDEIARFFKVDIVATRFETTTPCSIRGIILGKDGLLERMRHLRAYCRDPEHVQSLPVNLRYIAATTYKSFLDCYNEMVGP